MQQSKEVVKKEAAAAAVYQQASAWGDQPYLSSGDIQIPRLQLVQAISDAAKKGEAKYGEVIDSNSGEKFADFKTGLEFVPFFMKKYWYEYVGAVGDKRPPFSQSVPFTAANEGLPWEESVGKDEVLTRKPVWMFYVLLKDKAVPYSLMIKGSSSGAAKQLATLMYRINLAENMGPAGKKCLLGVKEDKNDKGDTFAVYTVKPVGKTDSDELARAFKWFQTFKTKPEAVKDAPTDEDLPF